MQFFWSWKFECLIPSLLEPGVIPTWWHWLGVVRMRKWTLFRDKYISLKESNQSKKETYTSIVPLRSLSKAKKASRQPSISSLSAQVFFFNTQKRHECWYLVLLYEWNGIASLTIPSNRYTYLTKNHKIKLLPRIYCRLPCSTRQKSLTEAFLIPFLVVV